MNEKKIYLILGASSDIGSELVKDLNDTEKEAVMICHYRSQCEKLAEINLKNGNQIDFIQADLSLQDEVHALIDYVKRQYNSPVYIVHLPANKFEYTKLKTFSWETLQRDMEIQVHALIEIMKAFLPHMLKRDCMTKVVIMLSAYTMGNPPKYMMNYIVTKYALLGLMKSLAIDYAGKNIRINGISPSMMETKFLDNVDERIVQLNAYNSVGKRNAQVSDIVPAIRFLLSDASNYLHGTNLNVTNGNIIS